MPTLLFSVWQFLVIFTILPIESVWCAVSQHTFIREETRLRMGRECRRPGSAQEENGWTLPWWQVILLVIASSGFWGGGGGCLSCSTQLGSHGTKFYIHDHDLGGFRCKYIYFDTGPGPWTNEKVVVVKKKKGGDVGLISYFISFSRINFRGKSILYAWLFIHILLLVCASPGCIEREEKGRPANPVLVFVLVNNYTHTPHAVTSLFY